jgi:hypothetical protein
VHPSDTSRASASELNTHTSDTTAHVTQAERTAWDAKYDAEVATVDEIGLVKPDGETLTVDESGTLSGIVVKHSDGSTAGPILSLSAKGWAEQDSSVDPPSPSPDYPQEIRVCRGHEVTGKTGRFVDLVVKQGNTTLSTTPIPLPSRGWVASLPDGTADTLTLDGAGKVTWTLPTSETTQAVTDGVTGTVGVDVLSSTGQIADGATVLYKLATPVTEQRGYVDLPEIPEGATLTIPELDAFNVRYSVDGVAPTMARQWYERAYEELGDSIVELAARVSQIDGNSLMGVSY